MSDTPQYLRIRSHAKARQFRSGANRFEQSSAQCYSNLHMLHLGGTSSKFTVSTPHVRNMGSTWGQLLPTRPQLESNMAQLGPSLGTTSAQVQLHMGSTWRTLPAQSEIFKTRALLLVFPTFGLRLPMFCPVLGPKLRHAEHDLVWAQLQPNMTN